MIHSEYRHEINCNSQHHQRDANESNRQGKHSFQIHHGDTEKPSSITAALSFLRVSAVNFRDEIRFSERLHLCRASKRMNGHPFTAQWIQFSDTENTSFSRRLINEAHNL